MTIAAGFVCEDGVLVCADTKVSTDIKTDARKIVQYVSDDRQCSLTFAMSSVDMNFPMSAVSKCWDYVRQADFAARSMKEIHDMAEFSLAEFYREHIYTHPDRIPDSPYLELLVGIWLRGETELFKSHETVLSPVDTYECIGSGVFLAHYLIRQYQKAGGLPATLDDAALLASCVVESATEFVESCGGEADMILLRNNGHADSIADSVIYPGYEFLKSLQIHGWKLLRDLAAPNLGDSDIDEKLERYCERVKELEAARKISLNTLRSARRSGNLA